MVTNSPKFMAHSKFPTDFKYIPNHSAPVSVNNSLNGSNSPTTPTSPISPSWKQKPMNSPILSANEIK